MKKILSIFILLLFFISVKAQFPVNQTLGAPLTQVYSRGGLGADSGFIARKNFIDTSFANIGFLKNIPGIIIRVGSDLWMRNNAATAWIFIGGESGAFIDEHFANANLTATGDRTHDFDNFFLKVNDLSELELKSTVNGTRYSVISDLKPYYMGVFLQSVFDGSNQTSLTLANLNNGSNIYMDASSATGYSAAFINPDTLLLRQNAGNIRFRSLVQGQGQASLRYDKGTGQIFWADSADTNKYRFGVAGEDARATQNRYFSGAGVRDFTLDSLDDMTINLDKKFTVTTTMKPNVLTTIEMPSVTDNLVLQQQTVSGDSAGFVIINEYSTGVAARSTTPLGNGIVDVFPNYINFSQTGVSSGNYRFNSLQTRSDTSVWHPMVWRHSDSTIARLDYWPTGGGAAENFANTNLTSTGPRYHSFRNSDQLWIDSLGGTLPLRISTLGTGFLRTVATDGTDSSLINVFRGAGSSLVSAVVRRGSVISGMIASNTVAQLSINDGSRSNILEAQTQNVNLNATKLGGGIGSSIFVIADSISFRPFEGIANIDTLASTHGSDTLFKPMVYKPSTGEWKYATYYQAAGGGGYTNLTQFVDQTAWRVFYSNTDGDIVELALGASGTFLKSNGASSAPTFETPAGAGTVIDFIFTDANGFDGTVSTSTSTPTLSLTTTVTDNQVMYSNSGAIAGDANFTWDGTTLFTSSGAGTTGNIFVVPDGGSTYMMAADATPGGGEHYLRSFRTSNVHLLEASHPNAGEFTIRNVGAGPFQLQSAASQSIVLRPGATTTTTLTSTGQTFTQPTTMDQHITMAELATPSTPAANYSRIYPKADGLWYGIDDAGLETQLSNAGGGGHIIEEDGTPLTARSGLNFVGAGLTATDDAGNDETDITLDADLETISGLTATTDNFIVSVSSAWASRTPAQVRTTLGLVVGTDVQAFDADLTTLSGSTGTKDNTTYYGGDGVFHPAGLSKGLVLQAPTALENVLIYYTPHDLTITNVQEALAGTTPSVTYILGYSSTRSGALTNIVNSHAATSTTGTAATLTANVAVPAGSYIMLTTSATSGTVNDFNVTISYRQ